MLLSIWMFALAMPALQRHFSAITTSLHYRATKYASLNKSSLFFQSLSVSAMNARHKRQSRRMRAASRSLAMARHRLKNDFDFW